jgi:ZIP family zinc transporter
VSKKSLPWTRISVISLDGAIDGLTLGIAVSIGLKEAALIALAMTVEMCFVGVTLSGKLKDSGRSAPLKYLIVIVVPLFMYLGFVIGAYALYGMDESDAVFVAVIGFSCAALLYLALSELQEEIYELLLVEKTPGLSSFWVTMSLFTGILIIIVLENVTPEVEV